MAFLVASSEASGGAALVAWINEQRTMRDMNPPSRQGTLHPPAWRPQKDGDGAYYEPSGEVTQPRQKVTALWKLFASCLTQVGHGRKPRALPSPTIGITWWGGRPRGCPLGPPAPWPAPQ